jgi:hypothetical protein
MSERTARLADLSTHHSLLAEPHAVLGRYGRAVRGYLDALLGPDDGEEAAQAFAVKVLSGAFSAWAPGRGRFRDYLKRAVHNAARDAQRGRSRRPIDLEDPDALSGPGSPGSVWLGLYRGEILRSALAALDAYQSSHPGNVFATLIRALGQRVDEAERLSDDELAVALSAATGKQYTPSNARMQASRARRKLAELIREEVARTLDDPTSEGVDDELRSLGLLAWAGAEAA